MNGDNTDKQKKVQKITFIKTNKDVTIDNTIGKLYQYSYKSWVWIPELKLKADNKYEVAESNGECFIREYGNLDRTYRVGTDKGSLFRTLSADKITELAVDANEKRVEPFCDDEELDLTQKHERGRT